MKREGGYQDAILNKEICDYLPTETRKPGEPSNEYIA